jgi:anti-sigma factor RsiW
MKNDKVCDRYWSLINDHADGRLRGRKLRAVQAHLDSCARCRESLAEIRRLREQLMQAPPAPPSPAFWERCLAAVAGSARPRPALGQRLWRPALGTAIAVAVTAAVMWFAYPRSPAMLPPSPEAAAQAEIPDAEYIVQHESFLAAQPLSAASAHVLISARAAEKNKDQDAVAPGPNADPNAP